MLDWLKAYCVRSDKFPQQELGGTVTSSDFVVTNDNMYMRQRLELLLASGFLWLIPFMWVGSKLGRLPFRVPDRLWQQYATAGLFTRRAPTWSDWRIGIRCTGRKDWSVLDMAEVSPMPASGYRQRLDRVLGDTRTKKIGESLRLRLAGWIAQKLKERAGMEVSGVRFFHRSWPTNTPEMARPAGHWDSNAVLPTTTKVTLLGTYAIVDGMAFLERAKPRAPVLPQPAIFRRQPKEQSAVKP